MERVWLDGWLWGAVAGVGIGAFAVSYGIKVGMTGSYWPFF